MFENPNPNKYVVRFRKGKPVLVDRAIIRWRNREKRRLALLRSKMPQEASIFSSPTLPPRQRSFFDSEAI